MDDDQGQFVTTITCGSATPHEIGCALATLARPFGFEVALTWEMGARGSPDGVPARYRTSESPMLGDTYIARHVYEIDPILACSRRAVTSYAMHWDDIGDMPVPPGLSVAYEFLAGHWASSTIGFPAVELPSGKRSCVAFLGIHSRRELAGVLAHTESRLVIAAAAVALRLAGQRRLATGAKLTRRERECLARLADGDRIDRIADRLGVAEVTVAFHLRNARRKLSAQTNAQCVVAAMCRGELPA